MNDMFEKRVRAAAIAGWWVVVIAYAASRYVARLPCHRDRSPSWLLTMWGGGDVSWSFVQTVSFWFMGAFKLCLWLLILAVLWLTLWARQLREHFRSDVTMPSKTISINRPVLTLWAAVGCSEAWLR